MTAVVGKQVVRSVAWSGAGSVVLRLGQLFAGILAARIMAPRDFGLFAVTLAVYAIVVNVSELGVGSALIRENDRLDALAPTAVTLSLLSSAGLAALMWSVAPVAATALGAGAAAGAIRVMAIVVLLAGPSAVPAALLTRDFRQDLRFRADAVNFVVATGVLIVMAVAGQGVMALAWSRVAGQVSSVIVLNLVSPRRYRPGFRRGEAGYLVRFGLPLVGANLTGYTLGNVDVVVLGRIAGPVPLGSYTLAYNVAGWPLGFFTAILVNIGLPVLSKVRHDAALLTRYLTNALSIVSGAGFFVAAMCASLAQPLVDTLYGPRWSAAAPVLAVLAVYGAARMILALLSDALVACNAPGDLLRMQLVWIVVLVPAMVFGVRTGGVVGAAVTQVVVAFVVVIPVCLALVRRTAGVAIGPMIRPSAPPLVAAALSAVAAHAAASTVHAPWLSLLVGGLAGAAVYVALLSGWLRRLVRETVSVYGAGAEVPATAAVEPWTGPGSPVPERVKEQ